MPSQRKRKQIPIAFSDAQHSWLRNQAQLHGTSVAEMVRRAIDGQMLGEQSIKPLYVSVRAPDAGARAYPTKITSVVDAKE